MNESQHASAGNTCPRCSAPITFRTVAFSPPLAPFSTTCRQCKSRLVGDRYVRLSTLTAGFLAAVIAGGLSSAIYSMSRAVSLVGPPWLLLLLLAPLVGMWLLNVVLVLRYGRFQVRESAGIWRRVAFVAFYLILMVGVTGVGFLTGFASGFAVTNAVEGELVERAWKKVGAASTGEVFRADMVVDLPAPARRFFLHAIQPGTPLALSVELELSGSSNMGGDWEPVAGRTLLTPSRGFVSESMFYRQRDEERQIDRLTTSYLDGKARRRVRIGSLVGYSYVGADWSKRAASSLALQSALWFPAALLPQRGAAWEAIDDEQADVILTVDGEPVRLTLTIAPDGRLEEVAMEHYLSRGGKWDYLPVRARSREDATFGGYTIPSRIWHSTWDGSTARYSESSQQILVDARFR